VEGQFWGMGRVERRMPDKNELKNANKKTATTTISFVYK